MPLSRASSGIRRMIEQAIQELLKNGIPADRLINQAPRAALPPTGNTGQGYTPDPDAVTRVSVRKNSAGSVFSRRRLNFIEGTGATITVADDSGSEEVDITIAVSGGGGGGGATISTGAAGSEPGGPAAGDLYLPNNSPAIERYSGSAWAPWGPIFPLTDPTLQTFAWINQGSTTETVSGKTITLATPAAAGYQNRIRKKSAPATPYTITAMIRPLYNPYATANGFGLLFRESGSGKLSGMYFELTGGPTPTFYASKWTDQATYSATYGSSIAFTAGLPLFLRIGDDGASRTMGWSYDGVNFLTIHTVGRTDFLTADEVGWTVNSNNASYGMTAMLLSWKEA